MAEFDDKLNSILSNPDAMAQIMQLAQSLSGGTGGNNAANAPPPPPSQPGGSSPSLWLQKNAFLMIRRPPRSTLLPYSARFRSWSGSRLGPAAADSAAIRRRSSLRPGRWAGSAAAPAVPAPDPGAGRSTGLQRPAAAVRTAALSQAGAAGEGGTGSPAGAPVPPGPEISGWMGGVRHV